MSHYIHIHILDPAHLPPLLRAIRAAVFPNNAPGVSSLKPPSSDEQLAALRRRCASALWGLLPRGVGELYYGTSSWALSGLKANIITNGSASLRTGPLSSSSSSHSNANNHSVSTSEGTPRMPLPDESRPVMQNDATLSSRPKGHSQEPNGLNRPLSGYDDEDKARSLSEIESGIVDIFSDAYYNKHLIYGVLELVLVRLIPELAERGVSELWKERLA
ncbi:hypothetical protein HD806DRAFT_22928 [Xylariaceae sp. AK1471]|nr:hypothetical protein HD806DRAFT_22928 [Xylariaceae sp. AK1471]